jgi:PhnB protein
MSVSAIPAGYHSITPYITVVGVPKAIEFYKAAFGATEGVRLDMPDGSVAHAELKIGDSHLMLGEENPAWGNKSPHTLGGTPAGAMLYMEDCDAVFARAVELGATVIMPVSDQFYGDRCGTINCPFGHKWTIATHIEDLTQEQMKQRMDEWVASQGA